MTEIISTEMPSEPLSGAAAITILVILQLLFLGLIIIGLIYNFDQRFISLLFAFLFLGTAFTIDMYRKHFLPDEMVAKVRLPKVVPRRELK